MIYFHVLLTKIYLLFINSLNRFVRLPRQRANTVHVFSIFEECNCLSYHKLMSRFQELRAHDVAMSLFLFIVMYLYMYCTLINTLSKYGVYLSHKTTVMTHESLNCGVKWRRLRFRSNNAVTSKHNHFNIQRRHALVSCLLRKSQSRRFCLQG